MHGWSLEAARQVSYFGASVGGTVIGFSASMLAMTDDLYKSLEDALSGTNNERSGRGSRERMIPVSKELLLNRHRYPAGRLRTFSAVWRNGKYDEIIRIAALDRERLFFLRGCTYDRVLP